MTRWFYLSIILTVLTAAASLALTLWGTHLFPEQVPTHWDINFQPDAFVPRDQLWKWALAIPGAMAGIVLLTRVLPWLSPRNFSLDDFRPTFEYVMFLVVALCAYLAALMFVCAIYEVNPGRFLVAGIFLFFALLGNVLGKVKRNFWAGVRTPWTLASEAVWERTHRLAAWLFVAVGVLGCVAALVGVPGWLLFPLLLLAASIPAVYSFVLYKRLERQGKLEAPQS